MKEPQYKVRPWPPRADLKDFLRIFLSTSQLRFHKLLAGDVCHIVTHDPPSNRPAIAWPAPHKIGDNVVQLSIALQEAYDLSFDKRVSIHRGNMPITNANEVTLVEVPPRGTILPVLPYHEEDDGPGWLWFAKRHLSKEGTLTPGFTFDCEVEDEKRSYRIHSINSSPAPILYRPHPQCKVHLRSNIPTSSQNLLLVSSEGVGGLDKEIELVNSYIIAYSDSHKPDPNLPAFRRNRQGGRGSILLHGVSGTGKSLILGKICEAGWREVFHINTFNENHTTIERTFTDALACQPSVIIIDNLENIAREFSSTDHAGSVNFGQFLSQQLDRINRTQTLAVGATRSLIQIDQYLKKGGRFEVEIQLPVPNTKSRAEILKVLGNIPKDEANSVLDKIAARTTGYVGLDLGLLLDEVERTVAAQESESGVPGPAHYLTEPQAFYEASEEAFTSALKKIPPSHPNNVYEIPKTKWTDIGGQQEAKELIQNAVKAVKYPDKLKYYGLKPPKGILLFGPPGCSKTMIARAAATESDLNFIAVKGAELLNMYVGESERAVREVFKRARAASPSIVFFDEIDAIGAAGRGGQQGGVHTINTLLNEMDGLEELSNVFVLAATNQPEILDIALIRAGRLSRAVYVGLPGLEARRYILQMQALLTTNDGDVLKDLSEETEGFSDDGDVLKDLSEKTEGFSGAELVELCRIAGDLAFKEDKDMTSGEVVPVRQEHWKAALAGVERSVTSEMVERYKAWGGARKFYE